MFGLNNNSDVEEKNKEEIKKKSQKKLGEDDDFEESGYGSKKNISKDEKKNRGRGNLKMNEEAAEEYE